MCPRFVIAVTDNDWFEHLRTIPNLDEVNFWAPSGQGFNALEPGELFLFKLKYPRNCIVGGGIFTYANKIPCSLAWEAFGEKNGAASLAELRFRIAKYRKVDPQSLDDFEIGTRILTAPFFLPEDQWIPAPIDWAKNTMTHKSYSTEAGAGVTLWDALQNRQIAPSTSRPGSASARYGKPQHVTPRLGQGAFRILVTDNYMRRCAVTGEKTLPALDAAHIIPYADGGLHEAANGLLLRRDIHCLFDRGYVTVTPDMRFQVSGRIKHEFGGGCDYYALHGRTIAKPSAIQNRPSASALRWHQKNRFVT